MRILMCVLGRYFYMSNYLTGEPMIPPSERELPLGAANIVNPPGPINYPLRQRCQKMDNAELEAFIREAEIELARRKNERANKLIAKACAVLNELHELNVEFIIDIEPELGKCYVFDYNDFITEEHFKIKRG